MGVENRALGKWVLAETEEEGCLITDLDVFVFDDGVLHRHYSNTESYIISTYIRPAGMVGEWR